MRRSTYSAKIRRTVAASCSLTVRVASPFWREYPNGIVPVVHSPRSSGNLVYHGGTVETTSTNYVVFWDPAALASSFACAVPSLCLSSDTYDGLIVRFFTDIGGSPLYSVMTQYGVTATATLAGAYFDSTPYPDEGTMTDADIRAEVEKAESQAGWSSAAGRNFFVITGVGARTCDTFGCSGVDFCGYDSTFTDATGAETAYADIPYSENPPVGQNGVALASCSTGQRPNTVPGADDAINIISHELFESVSDPGIGVGDDAWYDTAGYEIADKCVWMLGRLDTADADMYINGHPYAVQKEYSNRLPDCTMS